MLDLGVPGRSVAEALEFQALTRSTRASNSRSPLNATPSSGGGGKRAGLSFIRTSGDFQRESRLLLHRNGGRLFLEEEQTSLLSGRREIIFRENTRITVGRGRKEIINKNEDTKNALI
jgi:hypothetical protein